MEYSNLILNAKDVDTVKGIVSFYFADFDSVDSQNRRMDKNAFNRTIKNNFKRFKHLMNHYGAIGKPLEVGTDSKGAFMVSQLSRATVGVDALLMYQEGMITEHSFGFEILSSNQENKVEVVTELKMFEASSLDTWGSNPNTPTISVNNNSDNLVKEIQAISIVNTELLALLKNQDKTEIIKMLNDFLPANSDEYKAMLQVNQELLKLLKNDNNKEIITLLNDISARLPVEPSSSHQASQKKSDIEEVMQVINDKY